MSLDLEIADEEFNCTYNVSPMWYHNNPKDDSMVPIEGMTGQQAASRLHAAIQAATDSAEFLKSIEPSNGWGSYDSYMTFLKGLLGASIKHPDEIWKAYR